jgi:hypothetical protein
MRLRSSRTLVSYAYGRVPLILQAGQHTVDLRKQTLTPDPAPKPCIPAIELRVGLTIKTCFQPGPDT